MRRIVQVWLAAGALLLAASSVAAALSPLEQLGKNLYFDKISSPDRQACADCHGPAAGWTGPTPGVNAHGAVYPGAVPQRFGNRKPPSSAYATTSPVFHYDAGDQVFVGGNFWDGRATGARLGNPAAEQALGPFLNPVEQNNASKHAVLQQVAASKYATLWRQVWGTPVRLAPAAAVDQDYDRIGLSIAAFEGSSEVNAFSSKFDYFMNGLVSLSPLESQGKVLFEGKGKCAGCHPAPLFTDYTYDNLGVPKNPDNPFYDMDRVYLDNGQPINPLGAAWIDPGLGGFLSTLPASFFTALGLNQAATVDENLGKQKVPTLRNVDLRPGNGFPKVYTHNGAFNSLKEVVHFYNTRDVASWPPPEVPQNVNHSELGNLGLTGAEEDAIVAFLATLSDGYSLPAVAAKPRSGRRAAEPERDVAVISPAPGLHRVSYALAEEAWVRVGLYDVSGRRVRDLLDASQGPGDHALDWSSAGLPRGVYLLNLRAGSMSVSRKVLVME